MSLGEWHGVMGVGSTRCPRGYTTHTYMGFARGFGVVVSKSPWVSDDVVRSRTCSTGIGVDDPGGKWGDLASFRQAAGKS
jgi:hypothetical protein